MDFPAHIINAVHTSNEPSSPQKSTGPRSQKSPSVARFPRAHVNSSAEDISSTSDSEPDAYQTDFTTPASSDAYPEDMQEEVEDFRDREYPQLKGKTYLDHGGTTVRISQREGDEPQSDVLQSFMQNHLSRISLPI